MDAMMLQFRHEGAPPSVGDVGRLFGLSPDEIDEGFGVVETDPAVGLFTVLVTPSGAKKAAAVLAARPAFPGEGLFGNPVVTPF